MARTLVNEINPSKPQKNIIINGNFDFWQRGNSGNTGYVADRFRTTSGGITTQISQDKDADVPYGYGSSLRLTCNSTETPASNKVLGIMQAVEGNIFADVIGKEVTFSFWVKSNHIATYSFALFGQGSQNYISNYTIEQVDTWQKVSVTTTVPNDNNWVTDTNSSFTVIWELLPDPDRVTNVLDTWFANPIDPDSKRASDSSDNFLDTIGNELKIAKVQLTLGKEKSEFRRAGRNYQEEEMLCMRYFEKSYKKDVPPGTITSLGQISSRYGVLTTTATDPEAMVGKTFIVPKRDIPQMTAYSPDSGNPGVGVIEGVDIPCVGTVLSETRFSLAFDYTFITNSSEVYSVQWTADAEL